MIAEVKGFNELVMSPSRNLNWLETILRSSINALKDRPKGETQPAFVDVFPSQLNKHRHRNDIEFLRI